MLCWLSPGDYVGACATAHTVATASSDTSGWFPSGYLHSASGLVQSIWCKLRGACYNYNEYDNIALRTRDRTWNADQSFLAVIPFAWLIFSVFLSRYMDQHFWTCLVKTVVLLIQIDITENPNTSSAITSMRYTTEPFPYTWSLHDIIVMSYINNSYYYKNDHSIKVDFSSNLRLVWRLPPCIHMSIPRQERISFSETVPRNIQCNTIVWNDVVLERHSNLPELDHKLYAQRGSPLWFTPT